MFNIAIDGTTSSGKSTVAKLLAERLKMKVFDTGALYRAIACGFQRKNLRFNEKNLHKFIEEMDLKVVFVEDKQCVFVNGIDETPNLRKEEISVLSSQISPFKFVRNCVLKLQQDFAMRNECVMEGRDITSVVLPGADVKFFFDADAKVRAKRRFEQQKNNAFPFTYKKVLDDLLARDYRDKNRVNGKLQIVPDAIYVDSTNKNVDEMLEFCVEQVKKELALRKNCIVTGATGHIGNVLIRNLLENRYNVTALVLPNEDLTPIKDLKIKIVKGDVTDRDFILKFIKKDSIVFHTAGIIDIGDKDYDFVYDVNVNGTKNIVDACVKNKARRLIYTSTVNIIDPVEGAVLTEPKKFNLQFIKGNYAKTKWEATTYILQNIKKNNLDAIIVYPTAVVGPFDFKVSEIGQVILDFMNKKLYGYVHGGYNFVDVRDVAEGLRLASRKAKSGEDYILGGEVFSFKMLLQVINKELGRKYLPPKIAIWFVKLFANISSVYYKILGKKPVFSAYSIDSFTRNSNFSSKKAKKYLGYNPRPIEKSIRDSVQWFIDNGYYKKNKS